MKPNKIISCIIALSMIISTFSVATVAAATLDDVSVNYAFANEKDGDADGTVTISGIDESLQATVTGIDLYWGTSAENKLENHYNIKNYTVEGYTTANKDWDSTKLEYENDSVVLLLDSGRLIPEGATHLIAEVKTADSSKKIAFEIPANKRLSLDKSKMLYNMVWASDYHAENTSILPDSEARKGIEDFNRLAAIGRTAGADKFKGVIFNGDITNSSIDYEYAIIEQIMEENKVDYPVYYSTGNHDTAVTVNNVVTDVSDEAAKALDVRFKKLEDRFGLTFDHSDKWSYETYINGHHYIFLSSPQVTSYALTSSQAKWLEEKLSYDEKSGVPTFIFTHLPYVSIGGYSAFSGHETFAEILKRHPSAIVISSHVHFELDQDRVTYEIVDGTPAVDTSAVTYTNTKYSDQRGRGGYCRYVEVYPDRIIMKSRNVKTQQWTPRAEHIIYIDDYGKTIAENFDVVSTGTAGVIAEGDVLTAKLGGNDIPEGYTVEWKDMSGNILGTDATYSVTAAGASVSAKITRVSDGAYAYAVARHGSWVSEYDPGLDEEEDEEAPRPGDSLVIDGDTTVQYYGDIVYISGRADASLAGEEATMALISRADYPDMNKAKYFGYCKVTSTGDYTFKFKASDVDEGDVFLTKVGNTTVTASPVWQKDAEEELVSVSLSLDSENKVALEVKNIFADIMIAKLIIATYDSNRVLLNAKTIDYSLAFGENGEVQKYLSDAAVTGATVSAYLWRDLTSGKPLSDADSMEIPAVATESAE